MAKANKANFLQEVKEQYEDYPYPPRDPQSEKIGIMAPYVEMPDRLNHYCFGGKKQFDKNFRILVAGGGTGDTTIYTAEQYGTLGAEVVHVDLSKASIAIAKERAEIRGLKNNITFLHASLLDIPKMGLGKFDYINCSGVLHHLNDPEEGLASLTSVLSPEGVMCLMVYGKYGRLGVYPLQDALRTMLRNVDSRAKKIKMTRDLLSNLPLGNWFMFAQKMFREDLATDSGIFDLLLHPQDRAYTIPELYEFVASAGLKSISLQHPFTSGARIYDPSHFILNEALQSEIESLTPIEKQALAENLSCNIIMHTFYAARYDLTEPDETDENFIPVVNYSFSAHMKPFLKMVLTAEGNNIMFMNPMMNDPIIVDIFPSTAALVLAMDGNRTIGNILDEVSQRMNLSREEVSRHFKQLYKDLRAHDIVFLRHSSVPAYVTPDVLHANSLKRTAKK
ncbi:MAG: class I SAM-dependent methyltransferase [Rickettsiales bacterium]